MCCLKDNPEVRKYSVGDNECDLSNQPLISGYSRVLLRN